MYAYEYAKNEGKESEHMNMSAMETAKGSKKLNNTWV